MAAASSSSSSTMKAVVLSSPGGPEKLSVGTIPAETAAGLADGYVLVRVSYTGLNRADTLQRKGKYPPPKGDSETLGLEASGVVEAVAKGCKRFKVGDRVMCLVGGGGYAELVKVHEGSVMAVPDGVSLKVAAAIPEQWLTAFQVLHLVGEVKRGDFVLIHAAASGVGCALIQLVLLAGGVPIATAGSKEKLELCAKLGAVAGFNRKEGPWADGVRKATNGHGADVILDPVGGSYFAQNLSVAALDARWVLYGLMGGSPTGSELELRAFLGKRIQLRPTTLRTRSLAYKADLVARFAAEALPHIVAPKHIDDEVKGGACGGAIKGKLVPQVDSVFPMADVAKAHERMDKSLNAGKILLEVNKDAGEAGKGPNKK